ncbi:glucuronoarabinoxylan endo-1,4-beta-xylanase [Anaerobacterium chartisolvens]|uniref:Glucuronoarabinoxylan endo-1,4-beta-xylanase n=1 Tax=Anaerobacterium chartisolvens TaxID=1297424 RepID=A0A369AIV8_9FIRM|nr:carbohydrate-binding protein [Anaerobacterium chartisolvens]RCX09290.1 glucuronoarabinoxylan endo-1,4-beta-xylanase [Anaerobacterium chartisolvens]
MKKGKILILPVILAVIMTSFISVPNVSAAAYSVSVDINTSYQTLEGFGAAIAWSNESLTEHPNRAGLYKTLFFDSGLDILRLRNQYRNSSDFAYPDTEIVKLARCFNPNLKILLCSWTPPADIKENGVLNGGTLIKQNGAFVYDRFADYWYKSLNAYAAKGIVPDYISIQNEPDYQSSDWETCIFYPTETSNYPGYDKALDAVYSKLQTLPSMPKIIAAEATGIGTSMIGNNAAQQYFNKIDFSKIYGLAHHLYNGGDPNNPDSFNSVFKAIAAAYPGKPIFQTEYDQGTPFTTTQLIHNSLVEEGVSSYFFWDLIWDNSQRPMVIVEPPFNQNGWSNPQGYYKTDFYSSIQHYAKFTEPGYSRVKAESSGSNVSVTAFTSPGKDKLTLVLINKASSESTISLNLNGYTADTSAVYRTVFSGTAERFAHLGSLQGNTVTMPAQSVVTVALGFPDKEVVPEIPDIAPKPESRSAFGKIQAETYNSMSGIQTELIDDNGGRNVGYIESGDYVRYNNVDFGAGATGFEVTSSSGTSGGKIEIRLDGPYNPTVASISVPGTGSWSNWTEIRQDIAAISGKHDLYLYFTGNSGYLFNIDWFRFTGTPAGKKGDLNGDGNIDSIDYSLMKRYILELIDEFPVEDSIYAGDLNGDGSINSADYSLLRRYLLELISTF